MLLLLLVLLLLLLLLLLLVLLLLLLLLLLSERCYAALLLLKKTARRSSSASLGLIITHGDTVTHGSSAQGVPLLVQKAVSDIGCTPPFVFEKILNRAAISVFGVSSVKLIIKVHLSSTVKCFCEAAPLLQIVTDGIVTEFNFFSQWPQ